MPAFFLPQLVGGAVRIEDDRPVQLCLQAFAEARYIFLAQGFLLGLFRLAQPLGLGFFRQLVDARDFFIGHCRIPP